MMVFVIMMAGLQSLIVIASLPFQEKHKIVLQSVIATLFPHKPLPPKCFNSFLHLIKTLTYKHGLSPEFIVTPKTKQITKLALAFDIDNGPTPDGSPHHVFFRDCIRTLYAMPHVRDLSVTIADSVLTSEWAWEVSPLRYLTEMLRVHGRISRMKLIAKQVDNR